MDTTDPSEPRPDPPGERLAAFAARTRPASSSTTCPDAGLLAGLVEDRLVAAERDAIEAHLAACDACRAVVVELVRDGAEAAAPAPSRVDVAPIRRTWRIAVPAAAAILVAAIVAIASHRRSLPTDTEEALVASAAELAVARPDLFGAFRPLRPGERTAAELPQKRGALALFAPAGKVLDTRPAFRWESVPGVASWRVSLRAADGELLWSADAAESSLVFPSERPELRPGTRYIWEASGDGPLGPEGSRRAFDVASIEERRVFDEAGREIDARAPATLRSLLRAQFALRRGLYAVAADDAARFLASSPDDVVGRGTIAAARRALGEPAAEDR